MERITYFGNYAFRTDENLHVIGDVYAIVAETCMCEHDKYEMVNYPRSGFKPKPKLNKGDKVKVLRFFMNFYGFYAVVDFNGKEYHLSNDKLDF